VSGASDQGAEDEVAVIDESSTNPVPAGQRPVYQVKPPRRPPHIATVRAGLAVGLLVLTGVLYSGLVLAAVLHALTVDDAQKLANVLAGPQALTAAAVGFYYAAGKRNNS
jgi:hypothetical protein